MASPDPHSEQAEPPTPTTLERDRGIIGRWRRRHARRRLERLLSHRSRRALAESLRRTAKDANERRIRPGPEVLLHYRAAAVRFELLEIAALLEQARNPDPACVREIHQLLANGDSPLYHPGVHISELYATLHYLRAGLVREHASRPAPRRHITNEIQASRPDTDPGDRAMKHTK